MDIEKHDVEHEPMPEGEEPPPPGVKVMSVVRWGMLGFVALVAAFMWLSYAKAELSSGPHDTSMKTPRYQCPMHPQIASDEPGECPICHMDLEPISASRGGASANGSTSAPSSSAGSAQAGSGFVCPMHPEIRSDTPARCPICKMALEPAPPPDAGDSPSGHGTHAGAGATPPEPKMDAKPAVGATPPGTTTVELPLDRVQAIGVRTAIAEERDTSRTLRVTATVMPPEQGAAEVHVRSAGFVEAIYVDQTGVRVGAGQRMLALYSPEILQAQNELLATRAFGGPMSTAARRKLELLGMSPAEIDGVIAKGEPMRAITITTPGGGFVTKKNVVLGSYVTPETTLYEIQDLSKVYVVADVFLPDVGFVKVGSEVRFVPSGQPERAATAKVDLVYPIVTAEARTQRIRMQLRNDGRAFSPGEYGTVEVTTAPRRRVSIPRDALVDTGTDTYVFVVTGEGRYVPRVVATGGSDTDHVIIEAGLSPGERVVSGATFLIDSESRLRAAIAQAGAPPPPTTAHAPEHRSR